MATNIYISDDARAELEQVAALDKRKLVDEISWLASERLKQIESEQPQSQENVA